MRLVTFQVGNEQRVGVLDETGTQVVDLSAEDEAFCRDMVSFIASGARGLELARRALKRNRARRPLAEVKLLAPVPRPVRNIACVGKNYHDHATEFHSSGFDGAAGRTAVPAAPIFFTKAPSSVIGPGEAIPGYLDPTHTVDYEGELTVVIGTGGRGISRERAFDHVYGYTIINDVTSRALQQRHNQWFLGKSLDGFCPMGPVLVTADEIPDVRELRLITRVNGDIRQDARVADLIFDIPTLIETASLGMTLEPGDLIATGTCAGVGIGFNPPRFLKPGDRVTITIEPIGTLENPVA